MESNWDKECKEKFIASVSSMLEDILEYNYLQKPFVGYTDIDKSVKEKRYYCPRCGELLARDYPDHVLKYCFSCSQAIDWEDVE